MTLRELFTTHGLGDFVEVFEREHVAVADLPGISDEELAQVFALRAYGDRKRFRAMVEALSGGPAPTVGAGGATRVDAPPAAHGATRVDGPPVDAAAPGVGPADGLPKRLGSYRVLGLVGAGGMGVVVRARHVEDGWAAQQGGDVAIKLIQPQFAGSPEFRARFLAEAALGRKVQHPGLVPTWDVVTDGPWLGTVMSFVEGDTLATRVRAGGAPLEEVLRLLTPVGATLDYLHAHDIVHRDIKPANIVVRPDGRPVILDLGIAKDTAAGSESHTRTMRTMGTSAWMAPEQADAKHVDGAADRYALGLMAYVLLSGRMPWDDGASEARIVSNKLTGNLKPLENLAPGLPQHVYVTVTRMLSVTPKERFANCADFVEALRRDVEGEARAEAARAVAAAAARAEVERKARVEREQATRAQAEREAWEKAEREAAEAHARGEAERAAREKVEREAAEARARREADRAAREKVEREAAEARARREAERAAREKVEREAAEARARAAAGATAREGAERDARAVAEGPTCPYCRGSIPEQLHLSGGPCPYCHLQISGEADDTDSSLVTVAPTGSNGSGHGLSIVFGLLFVCGFAAFAYIPYFVLWKKIFAHDISVSGTIGVASADPGRVCALEVYEAPSSACDLESVGPLLVSKTLTDVDCTVVNAAVPYSADNFSRPDGSPWSGSVCFAIRSTSTAGGDLVTFGTSPADRPMPVLVAPGSTFSKDFLLIPRAGADEPAALPEHGAAGGAVADIRAHRPSPMATPSRPANAQSASAGALPQAGLPAPGAGAAVASGATTAEQPAASATLSLDVVDMMIKSNEGARRCFLEERRASGVLPGGVKVKLVIQPSGRVTSAGLTNNDRVGTDFDVCVSDAVRAISFPSFSGTPVHTTYTFVVRDQVPNPTVTDGKSTVLWASKGDVLTSIKNNSTRVQPCVDAARRTNAALRGVVGAGWTITSGVVGAARITTNETGDAALASCVLSAVRAFRFDPSISAQVTEYQWRIVSDTRASGHNSVPTDAGKPVGRDPLLDAGDDFLEEATPRSKRAQAMISERFSKYERQLLACWAARLKMDDSLKGSWLVSFTVNPDGTLASPRLRALGKPDPTFEACAVEKMKKWTFLPIDHATSFSEDVAY